MGEETQGTRQASTTATALVNNGTDFSEYFKPGGNKLPKHPSDRSDSDNTKWFDLSALTNNWLLNRLNSALPEAKQNYNRGRTDIHLPWQSSKFYIVPIYQGCSIDWDLYIQLPHVFQSTITDNLKNSGAPTDDGSTSGIYPFWSKGDLQVKDVRWKWENNSWKVDDYETGGRYYCQTYQQNQWYKDEWRYFPLRSGNGSSYFHGNEIAALYSNGNTPKIRGPIITIDPSFKGDAYNEKWDGKEFQIFAQIKNLGTWAQGYMSSPRRQYTNATVTTNAKGAQWIAVGVNPSTSELAEIKTQLGIPSTETLDPKQVYFLGLEDNNTENGQQSEGYCDQDYNDVVLLLVGTYIQSTEAKRYMVEDLGATTSSDIDFNDIVIAVESNKYNNTTVSQTFTIRALGGTLNFDLGMIKSGTTPQQIYADPSKYNTAVDWIYRKGVNKLGNYTWDYNSTRWSELAGNDGHATIAKMYNTGSESYTPNAGWNADDDAHGGRTHNIEYSDYICTMTVDYYYKNSDGTYDTSSPKSGAYPLWRKADDNIIIKMLTTEFEDKDYDNNKNTSGATGSNIDTREEYFLHFPTRGTVPQIIAFKPGKHWRYERDGITTQECHKTKGGQHNYNNEWYWFTNSNTGGNSSGSGN